MTPRDVYNIIQGVNFCEDMMFYIYEMFQYTIVVQTKMLFFQLIHQNGICPL